MQIALRAKAIRAVPLALDWRILLGFLFLAALGVRFYHINEPPLNFHAAREYRSLLIARDFYFAHDSAIPQWERAVAHSSREQQGILEPPITEFLVAIGYRLTGGESFWLPKLLTSMFWIVGAAFLYASARRMVSIEGALFSTAFYLFLPFAVVASRSFQPDPLMIMLFVISIYALFRYADQPWTGNVVAAASASGLALLVKPPCVFAIFGAFLAVSLKRYGLKRLIRAPHLYVFAALTLLPSLAVYAYSIVTGQFLNGEAEKLILPQLLVSPFLWRNWLLQIDAVVGFALFVVGLLGMFLLRKEGPRAIMLGLWAGYFVFGIAFNYNVATHNYYQLQLIPILALSLAPLAALVVDGVRRATRHANAVLAGVALFALLLSISVARPQLLAADASHQVQVAQEVGALVNHSTNTVILASDYGVSLEYHGLLTGSAWPLTSDLEYDRLSGAQVQSPKERFDEWFAKDSPDYFIVLNLDEYRDEPGLSAFLESEFPVVARNDNFLIFDLGQHRSSRAPDSSAISASRSVA